MIGFIVVIAKMQSYSWWLLGSWKSALAVIAVLGLGILLTNIQELVKVFNTSTIIQAVLWIAAATVVVGSLFSQTTQAEFLASAVLIGIAWFAQTMDHILVTTSSHKSHPMSV